MNDMNPHIPWHDKTWEKFYRARARKHLPHALLLSGAKGTGKHILAEKMVRSLLCVSPVDQSACKCCNACKTYESGANPDFMHIQLLEGKQQIGVDQIRQLSQFLNYTRSFEGFRVVLLEPVERMNRNAANSLLKSLEEPADNTVIILLSSNFSSVMPTIISRCQHLSIAMPSTEESLLWLNKQKSINKNYDELLSLANGSPLLALKIPEGLAQDRNDFSVDIHQLIYKKKSLTEIAKKWEKYDPENLINWQISWLQYFIKTNAIQAQKSHSLPLDGLMSLIDIKSKLSEAQQWKLYKQLIFQKNYIHTSVNPLMFIESMIMLWLQASTPTS